MSDHATFRPPAPVHDMSQNDFNHKKPEPSPTFFSNLEEGPAVVDTSSSAITVIIKGKEITGTIIDGGLGVNVR